MALFTLSKYLTQHRLQFAAVAALLAVLALPSGVSAQTKHYVAVGDSVPSGYGTGTLYYNLIGDLLAGQLGCSRLNGSYAVLWKNSHGVTDANFGFKACAGATALDIINAPNAQLGTLSSSTTHVTVTIGANDFSPFIPECMQGGGTEAQCAAEVDNRIAAMNMDLPGRLDTVYNEIQTRAPNAQIVVVGYMRIFEEVPQAQCADWQTLANRLKLNELVDNLIMITMVRAAAHGLDYADPDPYFDGHRICSASSWIATDALNRGHPNASGHSSAFLPALNAVMN